MVCLKCEWSKSAGYGMAVILALAVPVAGCGEFLLATEDEPGTVPTGHGSTTGDEFPIELPPDAFPGTTTGSDTTAGGDDDFGGGTTGGDTTGGDDPESEEPGAEGGVEESTDADGWPPTIEFATDETPVGPAGGLFELLDGEITVKVAAGVFPISTKITVQRSLISVGGVDLVGYIWGRHGIPLRPPNRLTVRVPTEWLHPATSVETVRLYTVGETSGVPGNISTKPAQLNEDGTVSIFGSQDSFEALVIGSQSVF